MADPATSGGGAESSGVGNDGDDATGGSIGLQQHPAEVQRFLQSDLFMRGKIQQLPHHEHTQIVAGLSRHEGRIVTNGRWCPFIEARHMAPSPPTAWFQFDPATMRLGARCAAPSCHDMETSEEDCVQLAPTDEEVEYCRRKAEFEEDHFKVRWAYSARLCWLC